MQTPTQYVTATARLASACLDSRDKIIDMHMHRYYRAKDQDLQDDFYNKREEDKSHTLAFDTKNVGLGA